MYYFREWSEPHWVKVLKEAEQLSPEVEKAMKELDAFQLHVEPSEYEKRERKKTSAIWHSWQEWQNNCWPRLLMDEAKLEVVKDKSFDVLISLAKQNKNMDLLRETLRKCLKWGCTKNILKKITEVLSDEVMYDDVKFYLVDEIFHRRYDPQDTCDGEIADCEEHNSKIDEALCGLPQSEVVKIFVNHEEWLDKLD